MTDDTDPQTEGLLNRIEAQQERIDDLEETVQQMLPSRRQVLAGAGIAGASMLTGGALTGGAGAAPQGQIGTSSTPVDTIYASTLDVGTAKYDQVDVDTNLAVNSLDTDDLSITPIYDTTFTLGSGERNGAVLNANFGDLLVPTVVPNSDPNNDFGAKSWIGSDSGFVRIEIEETENSGGAEVRAVVWKIGV